MNSIKTEILYPVISSLLTAVIIYGAKYIRQKKMDKDKIINSVLIFLMFFFLALPIYKIVKCFYMYKDVNKQFISEILIHSLTFLFLISLHFYSWIKRIERKIDLYQR